MTLTGVRKSLVVYSDMRIWLLSILVNNYLRGKTEAGFRGTGEKLDAAAQPCGRANYFGQLGARPRPAQPIVPGVRRGRQYHFGQGSERRGIAPPALAPHRLLRRFHTRAITLHARFGEHKPPVPDDVVLLPGNFLHGMGPRERQALGRGAGLDQRHRDPEAESAHTAPPRRSRHTG